MTYSQMRSAIQSVFDVDAGMLELMRVDLAADVVGVPVSWFERNVRAKWKRWTASIGVLREEVEFSEMGSKGIETFYLGKRPNVIRIYDKVAERRHRYSQAKARASRAGIPTAQLPTFEDTFGHPEVGFVLTRVERQMAAGRVPEEMSTFNRLQRAAEFNPFQHLVFVGLGKAEPDPSDYDLPTYCMGMYLRERVEKEGIHRVKQWINQYSKRNADRILNRFSDFLPDDTCLLSPEGLFERYRFSVSNQLAA